MVDGEITNIRGYTVFTRPVGAVINQYLDCTIAVLKDIVKTCGYLLTI